VAKFMLAKQMGNTKKRAPRIGFHAPIAGGLSKALERSRDLGCDTAQIFSRNPRGWAAKPLAAEEIAVFKAARAATGITPVVIHANYLVNLAAADETIREKSRASFREEIERGLALGADYLVVHPGSARGATEAEGVAHCAATLKAACDGLNLNGFRVLLENTAGSGACIGHRFEHLRDIIAACPELNLGVCLDTAHSFAAGYDWREEDGCAAAFEVIGRCVGLENVRAVHFNDSKVDYLSRVDRHWHIGLGKIGSAGLRRVAQHAGLRHAAFILETPQDEPGAEERNIRLLRSFVQGAN
jgi:deoxyribonuclease-4